LIAQLQREQPPQVVVGFQMHFELQIPEIDQLYLSQRPVNEGRRSRPVNKKTVATVVRVKAENFTSSPLEAETQLL
jgi:hypothetical protein